MLRSWTLVSVSEPRHLRLEKNQDRSGSAVVSSTGFGTYTAITQRLRLDSKPDVVSCIWRDKKLDVSQKRGLAAQKAKCIPGLHQKEHGQGGDCAWSAASSSGVPSTREMWTS